MAFDLDALLKRVRSDKTELANRLGVSRQTIYGYKENPSLKTLKDIAEKLEIELFELFEMNNFDPVYNDKGDIIGYLKKK